MIPRYVILSVIITFVSAQDPIVEVSQGLIRGIRALSIRDRDFYAFLGVPYAKPPVGELRFKAPQPPEPWSGVYDATEERDSCPQHAMMTGSFAGDENCLFLNIFTPSLSPDTKEALAVMVWIHGGCYKSGSGSSVMYGPDHLLTQDVILVTINYRLGMLGFLSLPAAGVTGNNGLKDQVMALRWVQRNIAKFGGDPNRVTLFGESAGGSSVHFHLLSPMSKGLFHRAIAQSGTALHNWAYADTDFMINKAFTIGERMKCNATGSQELLLCLKTAPAELIVDNTIGKVFSTSNTVVPMRPTSEDENASDEEVFLTSHPAQLLKQGKLVNDVPFIAGVNSREGIIYMLDVQAISGFWQDPNYHMSNVIADLLDMSAKEADELSKMAISYYTGQTFVYKEQAIELVDMFSDVAFVLGTDRTVKKHAQLSRSPVYMYIFSYEGELGISKLAFNTIMEGVSHADELGYIFHTAISPQVDDTPDSTTLTRMVKMWTNFAKTGEPIPEVDTLLDAKWNPSSSNGHFFMNISNDLQAQIGPFEDRMRFWEDMLGPYPETSLS